MSVIEEATEKQFVTAKAYTSMKDTVSNDAKQAARFPESNFTDVIPAELRKDNYHSLVLQAGSVDISNLNTKNNVNKNLEYFRNETIMSAKNAAVNAL